mgnify:CR=1 FL=1
MVSLSEFTIKRHKPIFWVTLLFISSTVIWIPKIEMNDSINNYFDDSLEFAKALKFANDNMSSFYIPWIQERKATPMIPNFWRR